MLLALMELKDNIFILPQEMDKLEVFLIFNEPSMGSGQQGNSIQIADF